MMVQGKIQKNDIGRWEFEEVELTSGSVCEMMINDSWINGRIEYNHALKDYVFLAGPGGIQLTLKPGMQAQIYLGQRRF